MHYQINKPDYNTSPFSGMNRSHWVESVQFLLEGVHGHVKDFNSPVLLPRQDDVTYPKPDDPEHRFKSAEYEGLTRTFLAAAPMINIHPDWETNGYKISDYYANQILLATDPQSPRYVWKITELREQFGNQPYQQVVEGAALCIGLMSSKNEIWDRYSKKQKDQIAEFISDYAHNRTLGHNWRYFCVLMLTFLKLNDYPIDELALKNHLQHLMAAYVGDGWYRDDTRFDFYIPWAFHYYGPLWCSWYGYEYEPEIAALIEKRNIEFMKSYPNMFSKEGHQLMWGRSIIYRCAASAAFGGAFLLKNTELNPGWARRIASGNLLQFLSREDVFYNNVPCLGFYGPYSPLVQFYSCAASPFWLSKIFVALSLPETSSFWTAKENIGDWDHIENGQKSIALNGPGLMITNHHSGSTEIRPAKIRDHKIFNLPSYYNRLVFNTEFTCEDDSQQGATAMQYCIKETGNADEFLIPQGTGFHRVKQGVLYRQLNLQSQEDVAGKIDLADIVIPNGMIRVDRLRAHVKHELHLGHFGLPHVNNQIPLIEKSMIDGKELITAKIKNRSLALVACSGWSTVDHAEHQGKNPEADKSTLIFAKRIQNDDYEPMELLITIMLHKLDDSPWTYEELMPIKSLNLIPWTQSGQPCGAEIALNNGQIYTIDFGLMEGDLSF